MNDKAKYKLTIGVARANLLFFILMTVLNTVILLAGGDWNLPYSSFICLNTMILARTAGDPATELGGSVGGFGKAAVPLGTVICLLIIGFLFLLYFRSKTRRKALDAVLVFAIIDLAALIYTGITSGDMTAFVLDLIMHGIMLAFTFRGVRAYARAESAPQDDDDNDHEEDEIEEFIQETVVNETEAEIALHAGLPRLYDNSGKQIISCSYKGYNVRAVKNDTHISLVINGMVYAEAQYGTESATKLTAKIDDTVFSINFNENEKKAFVCADGSMIAEK